MKSRGSRRSKQIGRGVIRVVFAWSFLAAQEALLSPAHAQDLTHMGQDIALHVTLINKGDSLTACPSGTGPGFHRVFASGVVDVERFAVPPGHVLVVTDVEWRVKRFAGIHTGGPETVDLTILVNDNPVFLSGTVSASNAHHGYWGSSEQLTSGFLVGPGGRICAQAYSQGGTGTFRDGGQFSSNSMLEMVLRGYLIHYDPPRSQ